MFNEVDEDGDDCVTRAQWLAKGLAWELLWRAAAALPTHSLAPRCRLEPAQPMGYPPFHSSACVVGERSHRER